MPEHNQEAAVHWQRLVYCRHLLEHNRELLRGEELTLAWAHVQIEALAAALRMIAEHDLSSVGALRNFADEVMSGKPYQDGAGE